MSAFGGKGDRIVLRHSGGEYQALSAGLTPTAFPKVQLSEGNFSLLGWFYGNRTYIVGNVPFTGRQALYYARWT
jgi:hypothetical protein